MEGTRQGLRDDPAGSRQVMGFTYLKVPSSGNWFSAAGPSLLDPLCWTLSAGPSLLDPLC